MKLSIIIPYYETYELTCKLLDVLIPQLTDETELYLIDDGCNETRLDRYKGINIVHLEENVGAASATNKGLDLAKGKYIALIDSDDLVTHDYVETILKTIDTRTEDMLYMDWKYMNTGYIVRRPQNYAQWKAVYRKEIMPRFRDGRIFSYDVPFAEDLEKLNPTKYYMDKVLYIYNFDRQGSLTQRKAEYIKNDNNSK